MITSTSWSTPSAVTTPSAVMRSIGSVISSTLSRVQGPRPDPVVAQDPLGDRRVVRQHLLQQLGVVGELRLEVLGEQLAQHRRCTSLTDRSGGRPTPGRPRPSAGVPRACARTARSGTTAGRTARASSSHRMACGHGRRGSRACRSSQFGVRWKIVRCAACSATTGMNWARAGAGADHRRRACREVDAVIPARRVERRAGERVAARDRRAAAAG